MATETQTLEAQKADAPTTEVKPAPNRGEQPGKHWWNKLTGSPLGDGDPASREVARVAEQFAEERAKAKPLADTDPKDVSDAAELIANGGDKATDQLSNDAEVLKTVQERVLEVVEEVPDRPVASEETEENPPLVEANSDGVIAEAEEATQNAALNEPQNDEKNSDGGTPEAAQAGTADLGVTADQSISEVQTGDAQDALSLDGGPTTEQSDDIKSTLSSDGSQELDSSSSTGKADDVAVSEGDQPTLERHDKPKNMDDGSDENLTNNNEDAEAKPKSLTEDVSTEVGMNNESESNLKDKITPEQAAENYDQFMMRLLDSNIDPKDAEALRKAAKENPESIPDFLSMLDDMDAMATDIADTYAKHSRGEIKDKAKAMDEISQDFVDALSKENAPEADHKKAELLKLYKEKLTKDDVTLT